MPSFLNLVTVWFWACKHSVHTLRAAASFTLTLICITLATLLPLNRSVRSSHIYLPFICSWAANRWLPNRFCAHACVHVVPACVREQRRTVWPANLSSSACLFSLSGLCLISEHSCEGKKSPVCAVCARICAPFFLITMHTRDRRETGESMSVCNVCACVNIAGWLEAPVPVWKSLPQCFVECMYGQTHAHTHSQALDNRLQCFFGSLPAVCWRIVDTHLWRNWAHFPQIFVGGSAALGIGRNLLTLFLGISSPWHDWRLLTFFIYFISISVYHSLCIICFWFLTYFSFVFVLFVCFNHSFAV